MQIQKVSLLFFSPTDSTKNILSLLAKQLPLSAESLDLTAHGTQDCSRSFAADELVIFGIPVYGGRVPAPALARFGQMRGSNTPAILIAAFGNRAYEDSLLELSDCVSKNGFVPVAAAAFVTEHSIMHSVARGRPDCADEAKIADFAKAAWAKISAAASVSALPPLSLPGERPFRAYGGVPLKPKAIVSCTKCGICAEACPVGAIDSADPSRTDAAACISCMRCMKVCPRGARRLNRIMLFLAESSFRKKCSLRLEPTLFL